MATSLPDQLRTTVRFLGRVLGDVIRAEDGEAVFNQIEEIRQASVAFHREGTPKAAKLMAQRLEVAGQHLRERRRIGRHVELASRRPRPQLGADQPGHVGENIFLVQGAPDGIDDGEALLGGECDGVRLSARLRSGSSRYDDQSDEQTTKHRILRCRQ